MKLKLEMYKTKHTSASPAEAKLKKARSVRPCGKDVAGVYQQYADSKDTSCMLTTTIYENQPMTLVGTQAEWCTLKLTLL